MTTLITGGTGKTGIALARLLKQAGHPVLIASRSGKAPESFKAVEFDWLDPTTFQNPFQANTTIDKLYLIAPPVFDSIRHVKPFLDFAVSQGVKRFVAVTSTQSNPGDVPLGTLHQCLLDLKVDYAILRPTWFIENFSTNFYMSIREKNEIFSSAEDGRVPFVSAEDIAQAAFDAFTAEKSPNRDYFLVGPELYSYDEAAKLLSSVLGREITHKRNSVEQQTQIFGYFLGGNGKTGSILAKLLHQADVPFLIASRAGKAPESYKAVAFNWLDPTTFENPFKADPTIDKIYIVGPDNVYDALPHIKPFLELAVSKGVKRFVALTSTQSQPGDRPSGVIHQVLLELGVDFTILKPTWFIENFATMFYMSIRENDEISTTTENGRVPFISAQDIAEAGFKALTSEKTLEQEYLILGPELHSYDDAAKLLSTVLGRTITHRKISVDEKTQALSHFLVPEYAAYLANIEHLIAGGSEEKFTHEANDRNTADMTILVTGGTGKTGSILAKLLHQAGIPVVIASRSAKAIEPFKSVKFDWSDPTTFENPFKADSSIDKVYVVSPDGLYDVIPVMKPFLEYAVSKGVKRFVALTGSQFNPVDGPSGATRQCVVSLGVDYTILRAKWLPTDAPCSDNFSNGFDRTIRESNELCTCGEDGKVPFVAAQDIAQAAFDALTADKSPNKDLYIVGPELFSHDEAMLLLSQVLGREIKHKRVSVEHQRNVYSGIMPADFAIYLAGLEHMLAVGSEERVFNETDDKKIMTILLTGGTGKTGLALAELLHESGHSLLITSRTGKAPEPYKAVKFDWFDRTTFEAPFQSDPNIDKVFLIDPPAFDVLPHVKPFIDMAIFKGVRRFVAVTTTQTNPGDTPLGRVHQYLLDLGVDYAVLRPTWFIENFGTDLQPSIRDNDEISSSGEDGKVPFVSVKDIARAAFNALTAKDSLNKDIFVIGPELYSYDEASKSHDTPLYFGTIGRREITHRRKSVLQQAEAFEHFLSPEYAAHLARVENLISEGGEEKFFYESEDRKFVGKQTLSGYIQDNRGLWMR
ncbi:hypothetical protein CVT25_015819 [Psilocybe cyanescens]|uniref:NAD-dependent epimerase/dehydratase domain-containing protein n=1 Tax=Psilocybe cyanescens TaxID=93625 RepID=A0A409XIF2_PSICY|nr:hypothetical protein CVT25_015819 [Psilocybe cyanescens]